MKINLPGEHNILNCLAALAVSRELSVPIKDIQKSLKSFPGIKRRYEIIGEFTIKNKKFTWIDDYGHHPTEIKEVLRSVLAFLSPIISAQGTLKFPALNFLV